MKKVILFGIEKTSDVINYYINKSPEYKVVARCVDKEYLTESTHNNLPVADFSTIEKIYPPEDYIMAIPMGPKHLNKLRENKYLEAKEKGYKFITFIENPQLCDTKDIGENVFIFGSACVQPFTKIGNNCIIWSGSEIGHHCVIEDNCFVAGARIAGCVTIKRNSFVGFISMIKDGVEIGQYSVIGMSSVVMKNIPDYSILAEKQTKIVEGRSIDFEDLF